jgi:hypothetical protein
LRNGDVVTALEIVSATGFEWRDLGPSDASMVYDLHRAASAAIGRPDLIRPDTRAFFEAVLRGAGRIFGVFDASGLLAYGVLQWDLPPEEDARASFGLLPGAPLAKLNGAAVRPGQWGSGLHEQLIARRVEAARAMGIDNLCATAAPGNTRSWENLFNQGFTIRALREQYGGLLRFLMYRDLGAVGLPEGADEGAWCDAEDYEAQRSCLASGCCGVSWRKATDGRREILYRMLPYRLSAATP